MTPRRREKPELRLAQILEQAIRLIGERGFYGLTVQALAKRCEISNAGLLHYFPSKDHILLAVLDEIERREVEHFERVFRPEEAEAADVRSLEPLRRFGQLNLRRFVERPEIVRFLIVLNAESIDPAHPAHDWFGDREQEGIAIMTRLLGNHVEHPQSTARLLQAMPIGIGHQWLRDMEAFDIVVEWNRAFEAILKGGAPAAVLDALQVAD